MPRQPSPSPAGRLSCTVCRLKKMRCDRAKPTCGRCKKLDEECLYPTSRQNHTGKRRQLRDLESRIAQVEDVLTQGLTTSGQYRSRNSHETVSDGGAPTGNNTEIASADATSYRTRIMDASCLQRVDEPPDTNFMVELTNIYFSRLHQASPMLHQSRYMDSLLSPPGASSPLCLRYIVVALAMSATHEYKHMATSFYQKARSLAESSEMLGQQEDFISLAHAQCWCLISYFEAEQAVFARASISCSRSLRIAQILGLHLLDGHFQMPPEETANTATLIALEERRRTWWAIFICDRFICATTGWPAQINEDDITTSLPSSDEAFSMGLKQENSTLAHVLTGERHDYSSFAGRVLAAHIFHRTISHISRALWQQTDDADTRTNSYWIQHRDLDNSLIIMAIFLPHNLKLPQAFRCQNAIFVNMTIHTASICLHWAAIWKCDQLLLPDTSITQHKARLLPAAQEIATIMRLGLDLHALAQNPLILLSVYIAALVFLDDAIADQASHESNTNLDLFLHILLSVGGSSRVAGPMAVALASEMERGGLHSPAIQKIKSIFVDIQQQPFPILNNKDPASLQKIFRHSLLPVPDVWQWFLNPTRLGTDLFDTASMDLQLQNTCLGEQGCCNKDGEGDCGPSAPNNTGPQSSGM